MSSNLPGELALIDYIRARLGSPTDASVILGIGDDAALLAPAPGQQLVLSTDTLVAGIHFPHDTSAFDVGWKTLAVNLSDLAAMGARPRWCSLNLSLPALDRGWLQGFFDGFLALAALHPLQLVGGDSTRSSEIVVTLTVFGEIAPGMALRRSGAQAGDSVWVSGWPGEAAAGLALTLDRASTTTPAHARLRARLDRPQPRLALGAALCGLATAAMDVSDGLLLDLDRLCAASGCGAVLELESLPISQDLRALERPSAVRDWILGGGDDYELLFTVSPHNEARLPQLARALGLPLHRIGQLTAGTHVQVMDATGAPVSIRQRGYVHHHS